MYPEFAFSRQMELILGLVTVSGTFCSMYFLSQLMLFAFGTSAGKKQKMLFAFLTGTLLQLLIYVLYLFGGMESLNSNVLLLVVTPSPIHGLLYYYVAQKLFRLSPVRSVRLISYVYLMWITAETLIRLSGTLFFVQNQPRYNYLLDTIQQILNASLFIGLYFLVRAMLRRSRASTKYLNNMLFDRKREILAFFLQATLIFAVALGLPLALTDKVIAYALALFILALLIALNIYIDITAYYRQTISNHEVHISALFKSVEELRGIKHDINNLLHTYSGFLELKEYERLERYHASLISATSHAGIVMELAQRTPENPALFQLFIQKLEYAERLNVKLILSLQCELVDLYIDNADAVRIISILLDNAIEAASLSLQRKIYCSAESKTVHSKLIIITNSTALPISVNELFSGTVKKKTGRNGQGLSAARGLIAKHSNCTFQLKSHNDEFSAYIELKKAS